MVDGTHIPFGVGAGSKGAYFNYKMYTSLNCLVLIDHEYKFNYVLAGKYFSCNYLIYLFPFICLCLQTTKCIRSISKQWTYSFLCIFCRTARNTQWQIFISKKPFETVHIEKGVCWRSLCEDPGVIDRRIHSCRFWV